MWYNRVERKVKQDKEVNMKNPSRVRKFPQRSKQSSVNVYRDGIAERLTRIEEEIKIVMNMVAHHELSLQGIESRVTRLEESAYGID
jgi:archaellum component FlaC